MSLVTGGCLCGALRYEASGSPTHPTLCHCSSCRRSAGAPMVAWVTFGRDAFRFTKGTPLAHASSPGVTRGFCGTCGSSLTYERDDLPDEIDVTVGTLDHPERAAPADHTWDDERLPWLDRVGGLPRFARSRSSS